MTQREEAMKDLKFVQLITGTMTHAASNVMQSGGSWTVLFALADDGTVWMWSGVADGGWQQCGPQPQKAAAARG
jgi:hypothetical protein